MNNDRSSEIVSDTNREVQNSIVQSDRSETVQTERVAVINSEPNNNSLEFKKWAIAGGVVILTLTICILLSKENDFCFLSTCNEYNDPSGKRLTSISVGDNFVAYAGGAASLLVLTTLVGIPLLPAVAISTGVWFVLQIIH